MTYPKIIVLDDDPTGTQTVQDVVVLTVWDADTLLAELRQPAPLFFILTNSRALPEADARALNRDIAATIRAVSDRLGVEVLLINRGDSTLRGHFPAEPEALSDGMAQRFDAWFIIPFFEEGGRLTRDDVHYVREGSAWVPVSETPFAQDPAFGYRSANLRQWVAEKTGGNVPAEAVESLSLTELRSGDADGLTNRLLGFSGQRVVVVNATQLSDLEPLARAVWQAWAAGKRFLFRSAASWVKVLKASVDGGGAMHPLRFPTNGSSAGGLVVVGSYVPRTTSQLAELLRQHTDLLAVELSVDNLLDPDAARYLAQVAETVDERLARGGNVVVYTSRERLAFDDAAESLAVGNRLSAALTKLVRCLRVRPRFLVAKGGITSSDIATKALGVRRAIVRGQLLPGVPVWETGPESLFPRLWYVVFPGNVGDNEALAEAVSRLTKERQSERVIE